jgi:hypothetical protein
MQIIFHEGKEVVIGVPPSYGKIRKKPKKGEKNQKLSMCYSCITIFLLTMKREDASEFDWFLFS